MTRREFSAKTKAIIDELLSMGTDECVRWPTSSHDWYVTLHVATGKWTKAHRAVCEAAHGAPQNEDYAIHSCDNKFCVNPKHLRWGTASQNVAEAIDRGLTPVGSARQGAILTDDDVFEARRLRRKGMTYTKLEKRFGISRGSIWHAVNGTQWKHLK